MFALLSQLPYTMFQGIHWYNLEFNVMFTLFFCFLGILFYDNIQNIISRWVAVFGCIMATWWCDWGITAVLYTLALWIFREDRRKMATAFSAVSVFYFCSNFLTALGQGRGFAPSLFSCLYMLGVFLALVLILFYNGEKGRFLKGAIGKWFFIFLSRALASYCPDLNKRGCVSSWTCSMAEAVPPSCASFH